MELSQDEKVRMIAEAREKARRDEAAVTCAAFPSVRFTASARTVCPRQSATLAVKKRI
ncbi:MAG: hypothetical protein LBQ15_08240 [Clostridium sp.]|nr:hypothetical protein [Clostridium sp.]